MAVLKYCDYTSKDYKDGVIDKLVRYLNKHPMNIDAIASDGVNKIAIESSDLTFKDLADIISDLVNLIGLDKNNLTITITESMNNFKGTIVYEVRRNFNSKPLTDSKKGDLKWQKKLIT